MSTADIKIPTLNETQSLILIGAALALGYVAWKLVSAGSTIRESVSATVDSVTDTVSDVIDTLQYANSAATVEQGRLGAIVRSYTDTPDPENQSAAETARLDRQNVTWLDELLVKFDWSGGQSDTGVIPVEEGPNAISQEWGIDP